MASIETLARVWRPAAQAALPPAAVRALRTTQQGLAADGTVLPQALSNARQWINAGWFITTPVVGTNVNREYTIPAPGIVEVVRVRVKTAPTGAALIVQVVNTSAGATGFTATATVAAGTTTALVLPVDGSGAQLAVAAGDVLSLNVTQLGSTVAGSGLTVELWYRVGGDL